MSVLQRLSEDRAYKAVVQVALDFTGSIKNRSLEAIKGGNRADDAAGRAKFFLRRRGNSGVQSKLLDIAQTNTQAGLNFAAELTRAKGTDRGV